MYIHTGLTFPSVGQQSAGPQWQNFDEVDACSLCYTDVYSQVLHRLSRPQTQTEFIPAQTPR